MLLRNIARLRDGLPVHFAKAIDRAVILQPNPSPKLRRWVTSGLQDGGRRVDHDAARWAHRATASEWQRPLRDES